VLVVDDEALLRHSLTHSMTQKGAEVAHFASAEEALEAVAKRFFDLCFLDLNLPGMDGLEAIGEIRRLSPKTQIALMTASCLEGEEGVCVQRAADYFLAKPFDLHQAHRIAEEVWGAPSKAGGEQ
jgi:CheY-like chemotaxis protein